MKSNIRIIGAVIALLLFSFVNKSFAQMNGNETVADAKSGTYYCYRVYLTDKTGTPYSITHPEAFLSQRAIDRRARYNIAITEEDLPLNPAYVAQIRSAANPVYMPSQSKWTNTLTLMLLDTSTLSAVRALPFVRKILPVGTHPTDDLVVEVQSYSTTFYLPGGMDYYGYGLPPNGIA